MCRGGKMAFPTTALKKWVFPVPESQSTTAITTALAASANSRLVAARGHRINDVAEFPLVVSDEVQSFKEKHEALTLLVGLGCSAEVTKIAKKDLIKGVKKRRHRGPLVIY